MRIALIYGSSTGTTARLARRIRDALGVPVDTFADVHELRAEDLAEHDLLIAGVPTWYIGELQDDWCDLCPGLCDVDLGGTRVAVFGAGDQRGYPDHFQDAMGLLLDAFVARGARGDLGATSTDSYRFDASLAVRDGMFCGLALDEVNQPERTERRIEDWCAQLRVELGLTSSVPRRADAA